MPEAQTVKRDPPLLRPNQVEDMLDEQRRLEATINAPAHLAGMIQNRGDIIRQLRALQHQLDTQTPKEFTGKELDVAVNRELELRESITEGMPTQAEMRRNPTGVVDKLMKWQDRKKFEVQEWKNLRLRLYVSGALGDDVGPRDVANLERYRPQGGAQEMSMDGAQIEGKSIHLPDRIDGSVVVMTEEDAEIIKSFDPEMFLKVALMSNEDRAQIMTFVRALRDTGGAPTEEEVAAVDAEIVGEADKGLGLATEADTTSHDAGEAAEGTDPASPGPSIPDDLFAMEWPELTALAGELGVKWSATKRAKVEAAIEEKRNE
jgi:hypothetical protein